MSLHGDTKLYRIGELAKATNVSARTIDYYTQLGLIEPEKRSGSNYRFYNEETVARLKWIETMKKEKNSLEEIKSSLLKLDKLGHENVVTEKLTRLQLHMQQLEKEVKELGPLIEKLKPNQAKQAFKLLTPHSAACIEALLLLLGKGPLL